jgi:imidazole glycerol phosphate synthase subunit HisF
MGVCQVNLWHSALQRWSDFIQKKVIKHFRSSGGIHSAEDAIEKLDAGASLVQLYTGFIYEGPALVKSINKRFWEIEIVRFIILIEEKNIILKEARIIFELPFFRKKNFVNI